MSRGKLDGLYTVDELTKAAAVINGLPDAFAKYDDHICKAFAEAAPKLLEFELEESGIDLDEKLSASRVGKTADLDRGSALRVCYDETEIAFAIGVMRALAFAWRAKHRPTSHAFENIARLIEFEASVEARARPTMETPARLE